MLVGGIVGAVVVVALLTVLLTRRAAHDDVHSVEGYHRSLHTLEVINTHPTKEGDDAADPRAGRGVPAPQSDAAVPLGGAGTVRLAGPGTVRLTSRVDSTVPPVPTPALDGADLVFNDAEPPHVAAYPPGAHPDKAMTSINHRPRRLAAPAMAVAAVLVLIVVLLVTGAHSVPRHHPRSSTDRGSAGSSTSGHGRTKTTTTTTSTTSPSAPAVSVPQSATAHSATYDVGATDFTVTVAATSGPCWVDATSTSTGTALFVGTLAPGERQSFAAIGPVTMLVGAPTVFVASVNGAAAALPGGFQTPFTMSFVTA
jgi:hypothetical protein